VGTAVDAIIGIGSNLGQRLVQLRSAVTALATLGAIRARSAVYETAPVGGPPQPDYLNAAVWLRTELTPLGLLDELTAMEARAGRLRAEAQRNQARTLDLDMLLLGDRGQSVLVLPELVVPHPRLHERAFALRPALDLNSELNHPALGVSLGMLLAAIPPGEQTLRKVGWL
jgi:2-amino-4-hydroxy-6-hydroxymethyldihydropteridine diphosphokinase